LAGEIDVIVMELLFPPPLPPPLLPPPLLPPFAGLLFLQEKETAMMIAKKKNIFFM
jgi:hypothetical protein